MSQETANLLHNASDGGVTGKHPETSPFEMLVAPTTSDELNTARLRLIPVACWRVDDIRFAFDSSFVQPEIAEEIAYLSALREAHREDISGTESDKSVSSRYPPLSLFGHADPTGSDDYNKQLSGRRATAIYALLVRRTDLWEKLYSQPQGGDHWGTDAVKTMLTTLGYSSENSAISSFQQDHDLTPDGEAGPQTRNALFRAYMDLLCTPSFVLNAKDDFLAGTDVNGKGDYQGCSEFNPMLLFSQVEEEKFSQPESKATRDDENAPNRRVVGLLFRVGSKVLAERWPCPRVTEGIAGCLRRFWSDGEQRRSKKLPDERREFSKTKDTFACRFYHRLTAASPCEAILPLVEIRLYDPYGVFIPNAPYKLQLGSSVFEGQADDKGWVRAFGVSTSNRTTIHWSSIGQQDESAASAPTQYQYALDLFLDVGTQNRDQRASEQLNNLGYPVENPLSSNTSEFQADYRERYNLQVTGQLDDATVSAIENAYQTLQDSLRTGTGVPPQSS
jgi:peptidoglycan hydrolase-like protein with peptidoglycan-binding domain